MKKVTWIACFIFLHFKKSLFNPTLDKSNFPTIYGILHLLIYHKNQQIHRLVNFITNLSHFDIFVWFLASFLLHLSRMTWGFGQFRQLFPASGCIDHNHIYSIYSSTTDRTKSDNKRFDSQGWEFWSWEHVVQAFVASVVTRMTKQNMSKPTVQKNKCC